MSEVADDVVEALARLVPQLSPRREAPGAVELTEMLAAPGTNILVARDERGTIVGTLTLFVVRMPSGLKARIEDVVVDEAARGQGAGQALTREAMELAARAGVRHVELTSSPTREAANRLYRRLGFEQRETNVYVWSPQ